MDIEYWKARVLGGSKSALRTFESRREPLSGQWLLETITDNRIAIVAIELTALSCCVDGVSWLRRQITLECAQ